MKAFGSRARIEGFEDHLTNQNRAQARARMILYF